ncbi:PhoPQ-activated pathogenicity-related protein [compost metagenome]
MLRSLALFLVALMPLLAVGAQPGGIDCSRPAMPYQYVVYCHLEALKAQPLEFTRLEQQVGPQLEYRRYRLISQRWNPYPVISPEHWQHEVEFYLPRQALSGQAMVVINNGMLYEGGTQSPDYSPAVLKQIALKTRTLVAVVSDVPNQALLFSDDRQWRAEDVAVAHTWKHFLGSPEQNKVLVLHVPMAGVTGRVMDLVQQQLPAYHFQKFILAGASKRGWAAWLAALADARVSALAPAVIEIADGRRMLEQLQRNYGGHWPVALHPYHAAGVLRQLQTPAFTRLMEIMDPLQYRDTALASRLEIPKYLISASGDDFFAPDHTARYLPALPGLNAIRVAPNSDHYGIRAFAASSLIPMVNRLQQGRSLPTLISSVEEEGGWGMLKLRISESPRTLRLWRAYNERDRDFRYACGVRYHATTLVVPPLLDSRIDLGAIGPGWQAAFIQATFDDGFVATSAVHVLPDQHFPSQPPVSDGVACSTLEG